MSSPEERPRRYRIEESDIAEADREAVFLWLMTTVGPDYADAWHRGLLASIQQIVEFPGPLSYPVVRPKTEEQWEVRRLLYYGPKGRRSRNQPRYRVLFALIEMGEDEAVVRVLRLLHGAQQAMEERLQNESEEQ